MRCTLGHLGMYGVIALCGLTLSTNAYGNTVAEGYDLYQVGTDFFAESSNGENAEELIFIGGTFEGVFVEGVPLLDFDFGGTVGVQQTGMADTIVRRTTSATSGLDPSEPQTVPIEIVALSLKSVEPVDLGDFGGTGGTFDTVFFTLSETLPSTGQYDITFDGNGDPFDGDVDASFNVEYDIRTGGVDGPILSSSFVPLDTFFPASWSHFPEGGGAFSSSDRTISGANLFLNGSDQSEDFFVLGNPLSMESFGGEGDTFLDFFAADVFGEDPNEPIFPDEGDPSDPFVFTDVPGDGRWFDPPPTEAYLYETDGASNFLSVGAPPLGIVPDGDGMYLLTSSDGVVSLAAGSTHTFGSPVDSFILSGINPFVDGGDPLAFPTFLSFDETTVSFTMTPLGIPEPATGMLAFLALAVVPSFLRKRNIQ